MTDRDLTADLVKRAHVAGYQALVLTVDTPLLSRRLRDERNQFTLPPGIEMANLKAQLPDTEGSGLFSCSLSRPDAGFSWGDREGGAGVGGGGGGGGTGVRRALEILRDELALALALAGCPSIASVGRSLVSPAPGGP